MTTSILPKTTGGKRSRGRGSRGKGRSRGRRQNQNQQQQNQQGGACGNSSNVASAYGGSVPNVPQGAAGITMGGALQGTNYGNGVVGGNTVAVPGVVKGGNVAQLLKGGNAPLPVMPQAGGSVLNDLAVPAVLLYANNTFGKRRTSGKRRRNYRNKSRRYRRR